MLWEMMIEKPSHQGTWQSYLPPHMSDNVTAQILTVSLSRSSGLTTATERITLNLWTPYKHDGFQREKILSRRLQ